MAILDEGVNYSESERESENRASENGKRLSNSKNICEILVSSFNALALWSDPAWTSIKDRNSVHSTAVSEWVHHQRIWMAVDKVTISEIIGSVRGVIPNSKLASYGDFRYDLDLEEMYDSLDEKNVEYSLIDDCWIAIYGGQNLKASEHGTESLEAQEKYSKESLSKINLLSNDGKRNDTMKLKRNKSKLDSFDFEEWILKCQTLLRLVRCIVSEDKSFDVWSDVLLKTCSKFFSALKCNKSLLKVMEAEVPLITDYRQLLSEPITMLEILSLPQPYLDDSLNLDIDQEDTLWLKLSSPSIKKLWSQKQNEKRDTEFSKNSSSSGFDSWLGTTNFLRRQRQKKSTATSKENIEILETEARDLIGSVFNIIDGQDEITIDTTDTENKSDVQTASKNYFPEAHGEWTRNLFPRRVNAQNEMNTAATSNGNSYPQYQTDRQIFCRQIVSPVLPPVTFPPPLYIPPPPLPNTLHPQSTQKLPFYLPSCNQPPQIYNYEKVHLMLPRNYMISARSVANDVQQSLATVPSSSLQSTTGTGLVVQQVSRYYNQSLSNPPFQTNISNISQVKQRYSMQDTILSMKSIQLYQTHSTTMDKSIIQHNENFIKEVIKYKLPPSNPNRISTVNKQSIQTQDLFQHNSGYSFQQTVNKAKNIKGDVLRLQNAFVCCPQYIMPKSTDLKQFLDQSTEPKKVEESNVSTQHKRAPLVIYNHQRSPVIEKLRKDLSSVLLSKQDLSYNQQKFLTGKLKQNAIIRMENKIQKCSKKYLLNLKHPEKEINSNHHLKFSGVSEQFNFKTFSSENKNMQNLFLESGKNISILDNPNANDKIGCSNSCHNVKIDHRMPNAKLKLTARNRNLVQRNIRFDQYRILLLFYKNLKMQGNMLGMESNHKWIWNYVKLHNRGNYIVKEGLEENKYSIILNYGNKQFIFRLCKDENRSLKLLKKLNLSRFRVCKTQGHVIIIDILEDTNNKKLNNKSDKFKDDCEINKTYDEKEKNTNLDQSYKKNYTVKCPKNCTENDKILNAEALNRVVENLFFNNEVTAAKPTSFRIERINGWTYFKIAIQMILKKVAHILMNKKYNK